MTLKRGRHILKHFGHILAELAHTATALGAGALRGIVPDRLARQMVW